ncbi:MAG: TerB family tellurite resistance protein [Mariprofundales bacterium]
MALFGLFDSPKKKHRSYQDDHLHRASDQMAQIARSAKSERAFISLLVKMMLEDGKVLEEEYVQVINSAIECVQLDDYQVRKIVDDVLAGDDIDLKQELAVIKREATAHDRANLVHHLWKIAIADEEVCAVEAKLLHRVADILNVKLEA